MLPSLSVPAPLPSRLKGYGERFCRLNVNNAKILHLARRLRVYASQDHSSTSLCSPGENCYTYITQLLTLLHYLFKYNVKKSNLSPASTLQD